MYATVVKAVSVVTVVTVVKEVTVVRVVRVVPRRRKKFYQKTFCHQKTFFLPRKKVHKYISFTKRKKKIT